MQKVTLSTLLAFMSLLFLTGCRPSYEKHTETLASARQGMLTKLIRRKTIQEPVAAPPAEILQVVKYDSPAGKLAAYLSLDPKDGKKHPAIIWITGGDCNSIGDVWSPAPASNDQSARAFREAGIVTMYPSLRGGNENPGVKEGFLGEIDDVLAAADYLAKQNFVDPNRIYLGGHSTGGTLALLTAEVSPRFRAVFSFGPVADIRGYSAEFIPFDATISREWEIRSPVLWLHCIASPVFVFEGAEQVSNVEASKTMARMTDNPKIQFHQVSRANHFSILAPLTRMIAIKILSDNGSSTNISFANEELDRAMAR